MKNEKQIILLNFLFHDIKIIILRFRWIIIIPIYLMEVYIKYGVLYLDKKVHNNAWDLIFSVFCDKFFILCLLTPLFLFCISGEKS